MPSPQPEPSPHPGPRIPARVELAWRGGLLLALTAYATLAAQVVRGLVGGFGIGVRDVLVVGAASLVAMLAVLPLGAIVDLPQAIWCHWLPERRWNAGRCPACAYEAARGRCPECGADFARPPSYAGTWHTLRRTLAVVVPAWIIGLAAGLVLVHQDEARFVREVEARRSTAPATPDAERKRTWPADFAEMRWTTADGFSGRPPFESPKTSR